VLPEQHPHAAVFELEPCVAKTAVVVDAAAGARQPVGPLDLSLLDEVGHLGEVAACMREADGERFGPHLVTPFHPPQAASRIADADARLRPGQMFLHERKRRHGNRLGAAGTEAEVGCRQGARLPPDAMARGEQAARPGPLQSKVASEPPRGAQEHGCRGGAHRCAADVQHEIPPSAHAFG
jgi:hypothetical protein